MSFEKRKRHAADASMAENDDDNFDVEILLHDFWPAQMLRIEELSPDFFREQHKCPELPLARIKKVMKLDEDLKGQMISAEAPVLFAKAVEMFIEELTLRSWVYTDENKRKTLQKTDLAIAIANHDQFDFLIDIVPREEWLKPMPAKKPQNASTATTGQNGTTLTVLNGNQQLINQILALVGQQQSTQRENAATIQPSSQTLQLQNGQFVQATPIGQPIQLMASPNGQLQLVQQQRTPPRSQLQQTSDLPATPSTLICPQGSAPSGSSSVAENRDQQQIPQVFQQVIGPDGSVEHVPLQLQLTPAQLQYLKAQFNGANSSNSTGASSKRLSQGTVSQQLQQLRGQMPTQAQKNATAVGRSSMQISSTESPRFQVGQQGQNERHLSSVQSNAPAGQEILTDSSSHLQRQKGTGAMGQGSSGTNVVTVRLTTNLNKKNIPTTGQSKTD